jgi:hypothetical protein
MRQSEMGLTNQKLAQIRHNYELKCLLRLTITSLAILVSFFALISLLGFITHSQWVNLPVSAFGSLSEKFTMAIFLSGYLGMGILVGIALTLWVIRTRI